MDKKKIILEAQNWCASKGYEWVGFIDYGKFIELIVSAGNNEADKCLQDFLAFLKNLEGALKYTSPVFFDTELSSIIYY